MKGKNVLEIEPSKKAQLNNDEKMHAVDDPMSDLDEPQSSVLDINWSCDGTLITAGINKSIVVLDISKVLSEVMGVGGGVEVPAGRPTDEQ